MSKQFISLPIEYVRHLVYMGPTEREKGRLQGLDEMEKAVREKVLPAQANALNLTFALSLVNHMLAALHGDALRVWLKNEDLSGEIAKGMTDWIGDALVLGADLTDEPLYHIVPIYIREIQGILKGVPGAEDRLRTLAAQHANDFTKDKILAVVGRAWKPLGRPPKKGDALNLIGKLGFEIRGEIAGINSQAIAMELLENRLPQMMREGNVVAAMAFQALQASTRKGGYVLKNMARYRGVKL